MKNEFIPYEQALALKELGFDEPCFGRWIEQDELSISAPKDDEYCQKQHEFSWTALAPLFQQAFRWFREKHNLSHEIQHTHKGFYPLIYEDNIIKPKWVGEVLLYKEAELACLDKLIEIVKNGK